MKKWKKDLRENISLELIRSGLLTEHLVATQLATLTTRAAQIPKRSLADVECGFGRNGPLGPAKSFHITTAKTILTLFLSLRVVDVKNVGLRKKDRKRVTLRAEWLVFVTSREDLSDSTEKAMVLDDLRC